MGTALFRKSSTVKRCIGSTMSSKWCGARLRSSAVTLFVTISSPLYTYKRTEMHNCHIPYNVTVLHELLPFTKFQSRAMSSWHHKNESGHFWLSNYMMMTQFSSRKPWDHILVHMTYTVRGATLLHKAPSFPEINLLFSDYMFLANNQKWKSVCVLKGLLYLMTDPFTSIPHNWMSSPEEDVPTVNQLNSKQTEASTWLTGY
jgi:hypothetical protein